MLQDTVGVNLQTYRQQPSFGSEGQNTTTMSKSTVDYNLYNMLHSAFNNSLVAQHNGVVVGGWWKWNGVGGGSYRTLCISVIDTLRRSSLIQR